MNTLSVVGLGRLGLPLALYCASKGYNVVGVDTNPDVLRAMKFGKSLIYEPEVERLLRENKERFRTTRDYNGAVIESGITFILVPTPSEEGGGFSTNYVEAVAEDIGKALQQKNSFHIVVVVSTVMPGATETVIKPILENISGKQCGVDFGLCYNPEFVALGSVIRDLANPDAILIGESDSQSGDMLAEVYKEICDNNPPIVRTNFYNAEVAKLALNVFITTKVTLANTFAEICEQLPGGDVDVVTKFLGLDSRIGSKYLKGGLGYGGPCFVRDNLAYMALAKELGTQSWLQEATDKVNRSLTKRVVKLAHQQFRTLNGVSIAILGITYKPNTNVVEESASLDVAKELLKAGARLQIYDPSGSDMAWQVLGDKNATYATSIVECLSGTQLCILATPWEYFRGLGPDDFIMLMKEPRLLDCWRFFDKREFLGKMEYHTIGTKQ